MLKINKIAASKDVDNKFTNIKEIINNGKIVAELCNSIICNEYASHMNIE